MNTKLFTGIFTAKYRGTCALQTCERQREIEPGDACQYVDEELHHMVCARRVHRGQTEKLCTTCYLYHPAGDCE